MNWTRKQLKQNARGNLKRNYINTLLITLLIAVLARGYPTSTVTSEIDMDALQSFYPPSISSSIKRTVDNIRKLDDLEQQQIKRVEQKLNIKNASDGFFASIINNSGASNSFIVGVVNSINKFVFDGKIVEGLVIVAATIASLLFVCFVQNILLVGETRFFLENKNYHGTRARSLLFVYNVKRVMRVAGIMFLRSLYTLLWAFTIVGGFIKHYEYMMIPYILAENPDITRKEAFQLSKQMMYGQKWAACKLQLSFAPWTLLSSIVFGLLRIFYINPYSSATKAELYYVLRENALANENPLALTYLNDKYLLQKPAGYDKEIYPDDKFTLPVSKSKIAEELDYERDYSISSLILIFFSISFIGWLWEVSLYIFRDGTFVKRGTMLGPWLPIYGTGAMLVLILLKPLIKRPEFFFPSSILVFGVLEYSTSWILQKMFNKVWWDYSTVFFNINGRVCLEGLLFFALGGCLIAYLLAPLIDEMVQKIPKKTRTILCVILVSLFSADFIHSVQHPNTGKGITVEPTSKKTHIIYTVKENKP